MLDQQMLDLLVDGELTDDQERALLFELSRTPDGWQQCALAFLEARCWHRGFAGLQRQLADVSRTVVRKPAARERNVPGWAWTLMLAGVFVLAFGVGSFLPRPWSRSPGNHLAGPANVPATIDLAGHSRAPSDQLPWPQLVQPRHQPIGDLTLVDGSGETVKVPVYDWDLEISVIRKADTPVAITVTRGEQRWDVDEKSLDRLPDDIRPHLERLFGRGVSVSIGPQGVSWLGDAGSPAAPKEAQEHLNLKLKEFSTDLPLMQHKLEAHIRELARELERAHPTLSLESLRKIQTELDDLREKLVQRQAELLKTMENASSSQQAEAGKNNSGHKGSQD